MTWQSVKLSATFGLLGIIVCAACLIALAAAATGDQTGPVYGLLYLLLVVFAVITFFGAWAPFMVTMYLRNDYFRRHFARQPSMPTILNLLRIRDDPHCAPLTRSCE